MTIKLGNNQYGKADVKLIKMKRTSEKSELFDLDVQITLKGDFKEAFRDGDNSKVLPTDTQKNTVYTLAKLHDFDNIETFGTILAKHFHKNNPNINTVIVKIHRKKWNRMKVDGEEDKYSFTGSVLEIDFCKVKISGDKLVNKSGIVDLEVLKTTKSGFEKFMKDEYTTLGDTNDRIFATNLEAYWNFSTFPENVVEIRNKVNNLLRKVFANHDSLSVQHTLYYMGKKVLEEIPEIIDIQLKMPNQHKILFDLGKFNMENKNEIFFSIPEPFGVIEAKIVRE